MIRSILTSVSVLYLLCCRIAYTYIPSMECHMGRSFLLWIQFLDWILFISSIICGYSFLTILYLYHDPSRNTIHLSISLDCLKGVFMMNIILLCDIFGIPIHWSVDSDHFEKLSEELVLKFVRLVNVNVFYVGDTDRNQVLDCYKDRYKKLHFHRLSNPENQSGNHKNNNSDAQLSTENSTTPSNQVLPTEKCVSTEPSGICNDNFTVPKGPNSSSEHKIYAKNNDEINQYSISLMCIHRQNNINAFSEGSEVLTTNSQELLNQNRSNDSVTCSICNHQVERNKIHEHYLSGIHQRVMTHILLQLTIIKNNQQKQLEFLKIGDTISIASNDTTTINNNIQRMNDELCTSKNSLQVVTQELDSVKLLAEENEYYLCGVEAAQDFYDHAINSVQQCLTNRQLMSFDGTFIWKINDVDQKMEDAKFERQKSIYSPEFFSSLFGYKMRSRLFLNGINNARGTHLSIFFILMRGEYDAILKWPFVFKVSFTLLDQSTSEDNRRHCKGFFWPDMRLKCFQRPRSEMNEAYGLENFVSLEQFRQNQDRYVQNDMMFIKVKVDFESGPPEFSLDSGRMLMNDERHTDTNDDDLMRKFLFMIESSDGIQ